MKNKLMLGAGVVGALITAFVGLKGVLPLWQNGTISNLPLLGAILLFAGFIYAILSYNKKIGLGSMSLGLLSLAGGYLLSIGKMGNLIYTRGLIGANMFSILILLVAISAIVDVIVFALKAIVDNEVEEPVEGAEGDAAPYPGATMTKDKEGNHILTPKEVSEHEPVKEVEGVEESESKADEKPVLKTNGKRQDEKEAKSTDEPVDKKDEKKSEDDEAEDKADKDSKDNGEIKAPNGDTVILPEENPRLGSSQSDEDDNKSEAGKDEDKDAESKDDKQSEKDKPLHKSRRSKRNHEPKH